MAHRSNQSGSHDRYVVGLFENPGEAEMVARELTRAEWLDSNDVHTVGRGGTSASTDDLREHGVPDDDARIYAEGVRRGGCLVTVETDDRHFAAAVELMRRHGAVDIDRLSDGAPRTPRADSAMRQETGRREMRGEMGARGMQNEAGRRDEVVIPETEEQIRIGKERRQTGGARIYTRERKVPVEKDVTLREEHVDVERRKVDRPATEQDMSAFRGGDVTITEHSERPVVSKEQRVTGEVRVGKHAEEHTEHVKDTARKREVHVDRLEDDRGAPKRNPRR